ncbi:MAG: acyltransferase [Bacteroidetes bacterium]|nr:acyltransferase [Bacteroidota bacterium]
MNKLKQLEGLRGIAALIVIACHFCLFFISKPELKIEEWAYTSSSTLNNILSGFIKFFIDGELAVYIFWTMSAYVISIGLFKNNQPPKLKLFIKRYIRLSAPVLAASLISFVLLASGLIYNQQVAKLQGVDLNKGWLQSMLFFDADFFMALKTSLWNCFFNYDDTNTYNAVLWTMGKELWGSFICFAFIGLFRKTSFRFLIYMLVAAMSLKFDSIWPLSFILGLGLCDLHYNPASAAITNHPAIRRIEKHFKESPLIYLYLLPLIALGGQKNYYTLSNTFISFGIVFICIYHGHLTQLFSSKILVYLGKISFSLYLIHLGVICSLTSYLYMQEVPVFLNISASLIVMFIVAHLFQKYIDKKTVETLQKF